MRYVRPLWMRAKVHRLPQNCYYRKDLPSSRRTTGTRLTSIAAAVHCSSPDRRQPSCFDESKNNNNRIVYLTVCSSNNRYGRLYNAPPLSSLSTRTERNGTERNVNGSRDSSSDHVVGPVEISFDFERERVSYSTG